jgi:nucleotide-binding universal stress UspA family protein
MTPVDGAILVGVDAGTRGWEALAWASAEAAAGGCPLRIVHVVEWPRVSDAFAPPLADRTAAVRAAGDLVLEEAVSRARDIAPDLRIVAQLEAGGRPRAAILREGRDDSLIVLGRRRDGRGIHSRFGWSVGSYVARRTQCPIVIVGLAGAAAGPSAGRVAVVVDGHTEPSAALAFGFRAAARRSIGVTVLHAGSTRTARQTTLVEALRICRDAFPAADVREQTLSAPLGPALAAASEGAALLVLGARRRGHVHRTVLAPVARSAVDAAQTPVLIVNSVNTM